MFVNNDDFVQKMLSRIVDMIGCPDIRFEGGELVVSGPMPLVQPFVHRHKGMMHADDTFERWKFDVFGNLMFATRPLLARQLACDFTNWIACIDDAVELMTEVEASEFLVGIWDSTHPLSTACKELRYRCLGSRTDPWTKARMDGVFARLFDAYVLECECRTLAIIQTESMFASERTKSAGLEIYQEMYINSCSFSETSRLRSPNSIIFFGHVNILTWMANDICTYKFDDENENSSSCVAQTKQRLGCSLEEAWRMCTISFDQKIHQLVELGSVSRSTIEYATCIIASLAWVSKTRRYQGTE